jgi:acyl-CoA synthetase (AMP-forming)/AMP-acid ligase II
MGKPQNVIAELYENRDPDSVFFIDIDGRSLTTRKAFERIKQYAGVVASLGVVPGDRVSFRLRKNVDAILLTHGCLWAGAIVHLLNNACTDHELGALLTDAQPKLLFCESDERRRLEPLARDAGANLEISPSAANEASITAPDTASMPPDPERPAALLYVVAAVELSTPIKDFDESSVIAAVRSRLAAYKIPKRVFAVSELPRNAMGKLLKARLREDHSGAFRR